MKPLVTFLIPTLCLGAQAPEATPKPASQATPSASQKFATPGVMQPEPPAPRQSPAPPAAVQENPRRVSVSVRDADLKDLLRAVTEGTDWNLSFESGLDTHVKGMDLKAVTLEELLEEVLPNLGLGYVQRGRTLYIHKSESALRFYQVDHLSMNRSGTKEFMVNASGQVIQSTGGGGGGSAGGGSAGSGTGGSAGGSGGGSESGHSSAYASSLSTSNGFDPWQELQVGLSTLVFGQPMGGEQPSPSPMGGSAPASPTARAFSRDGRTLIINPGSGLVVVGADASVQERVEKYIHELRRRNRRQVLLEARIVEVTLGHDSQIGVDWNGLLTPGGASGNIGTDIRGLLTGGDTLNPNVQPGDGLAKLVIQNARVIATLSALAREGRLQVLSAPRISTLNNQKAILRVVREEAFFLQNSQQTPTGGLGGAIATVQITPIIVPVGIVLDIQPQIAEDGTITLAVNPSVSEIVTVRTLTVGGGGGANGASATLPVVDRRDLDTVVRMRSGETLVLAGIIRTKEGTDDRGVPWLRKLPFFGNLFSKKETTKSHTELAIFITPTLVEDPAQIGAQREDTEGRLRKAGAKLQPQPGMTTEIKDP